MGKQLLTTPRSASQWLLLTLIFTLWRADGGGVTVCDRPQTGKHTAEWEVEEAQSQLHVSLWAARNQQVGM